MMNCILIGYGQIGQAVKKVYGRHFKMDVYDSFVDTGETNYLDEYDLMLVTIPYCNNFDHVINNYKIKFNVKNVIIFSTVEIGTTSKIKNAVHCPIEGKHPDLAISLKNWQVIMGGFNLKAHEFFRKFNKEPRILEKPEHSEFLKLQSTTNYGIQIEYARYLKTICDDLELSYVEVIKYNQDYNTLYKDLKYEGVHRQIVKPPEGKIGGHCILPNAELLDEQYPNFMVNNLVEVNKGWK